MTNEKSTAPEAPVCAKICGSYIIIILFCHYGYVYRFGERWFTTEITVSEIFSGKLTLKYFTNSLPFHAKAPKKIMNIRKH